MQAIVCYDTEPIEIVRRAQKSYCIPVPECLARHIVQGGWNIREVEFPHRDVFLLGVWFWFPLPVLVAFPSSREQERKPHGVPASFFDLW
jgi:hypothetical protein